MNATEFRDFILKEVPSSFRIKKEIKVKDRGDGRGGRIDLLLIHESGKTIALELDRKVPREKSIFKLKQLAADESYVITREPFYIYTV